MLHHQVIKVKSSGKVFVNSIESQLPLFKCELPKLNKATTSAEKHLQSSLTDFTAYLSVFKPSSFYTLISTRFGINLMVQLSPIMQVFLSADSSLNGTTAGSCHFYSNTQTDELTAAYISMLKYTPHCYLLNVKTFVSL